MSGERWSVCLKVVLRFKARPSIAEVENVLYNLIAINSHVTKSGIFLEDLVLNVTGKKCQRVQGEPCLHWRVSLPICDDVKHNLSGV